MFNKMASALNRRMSELGMTILGCKGSEMLPTPWDNPFPKISAISQFPRHIKCKSLALPSHHTLHKQPLCTLGGASTREKLKSPAAVVEIVPWAEGHGRHAQDLILCCKEV